MLLAEKGAVCVMFGGSYFTFPTNNADTDWSVSHALEGLRSLPDDDVIWKLLRSTQYHLYDLLIPCVGWPASLSYLCLHTIKIAGIESGHVLKETDSYSCSDSEDFDDM